jgi:hypothetical protein
MAYFSIIVSVSFLQVENMVEKIQNYGFNSLAVGAE